MGFLLNWNMFVEFPRQHGKTISAVVWYLWVFNFGTTNSEMMFMNKKHDDSKMNLRRLKDIRDALPSYLQMKEMVMPDGKIKKASNNVESTTNIINNIRMNYPEDYLFTEKYISNFEFLSISIIFLLNENNL